LLVINKLLLTLLLITLFTSCTKKEYYKSKSYKSSNSYMKIKNQGMKNSAAMQRATMRSYFVMGKRYYPTKTYTGEQFVGIASWYGPNFHAKKTSNGETYNMYAQTAASKTLPMNTMVKVFNKDNGLSTIVRVNDRGPFVSGRIIDLSNKAAHDIDMVKNGTANVIITIVGSNGIISNNNYQENKQSQNFYIQVGAYSKIQGAKSVKRRYQNELENQYEVIIKQEEINNIRINRVLIGKFNSEQQADEFRNNNGIINSRIIEQY